MNTVEKRLALYDLYEKMNPRGTVLWYHKDICPTGVICFKPSNIDYPFSYEIPNRECVGDVCKVGELDWTQDFNLGSTEDGWNWGILHCEVEALFNDGWKCKLNPVE